MRITEGVHKLLKSKNAGKANKKNFKRQQKIFENMKAKGVVRQGITPVDPLDTSPTDMKKVQINTW